MNRRAIGLIILVLGALALTWLFLSFFGTSKITITAPDVTPDSASVSVVISRNNVLEEEFSLEPGESRSFRLQKGTVRVDGTAGNLKAVDVVQIGKTKELITPASSQHNTSKLGLNAAGCAVVLAEKVFSYDCLSSGLVVKHTSANRTIPAFNGQIFTELYPVKNGLIGFYRDKLNELQFLNLETETVSRIQLPAHVQAELNQDFPLISVSSDPESEAFALYFSLNKKMFVFKSPSDTAPVELKPPIKLDEEGRRFRIIFSEDEFLVLASNIESDEHDGTEYTGEQEVPLLPSFIFEFKADGTLSKTIDIPAGFEFSKGAYGFTGNFYALDVNTSLVFFHLKDNKLRQVYDITDVSTWITLKDKAYIQTYGVFYEFVPSEDGLFGLHSVFSSPELSVSRLFTSVRGLVFTAHVVDSEGQVNIYQLLDSVIDPSQPVAPSLRVDTQFSGFEDFINYGVSADQVQGLKDAIKAFMDQSGNVVERATAFTITVTAPPRGSVGAPDVANFNLTLGGVTYKAKMEYFDLSQMRLYLFNLDGAQVFDSGAPQ